MADYQNANQENEEEQVEAQDWTDFQEEQRDRTEEMWDEQDSSGFPTQNKPESLFSLFKSVWRTEDSTKVANINPKTELGDLGLSVRQCQKMSHVAYLLNEYDVSKYFDSLGEITLATSMAKNGWFTELFVSQKKFAQKGNMNNLKQNQNKGGFLGMFSKPNNTESEQQ